MSEYEEMSGKNQHGYFCPSDCDFCQADVLGCDIQKEAERLKKPMNYCEFIKCHYGEAREDLGGCGIAWSGETCYSLYPSVKLLKSLAYYIHLEEVRLNNE